MRAAHTRPCSAFKRKTAICARVTAFDTQKAPPPHPAVIPVAEYLLDVGVEDVRLRNVVKSASHAPASVEDSVLGFVTTTS
jgi:hypothetical protein